MCCSAVVSNLFEPVDWTAALLCLKDQKKKNTWFSPRESPWKKKKKRKKSRCFLDLHTNEMII